MDDLIPVAESRRRSSQASETAAAPSSPDDLPSSWIHQVNKDENDDGNENEKHDDDDKLKEVVHALLQPVWSATGPDEQVTALFAIAQSMKVAKPFLREAVALAVVQRVTVVTAANQARQAVWRACGTLAVWRAAVESLCAIAKKSLSSSPASSSPPSSPLSALESSLCILRRILLTRQSQIDASHSNRSSSSSSVPNDAGDSDHNIIPWWQEVAAEAGVVYGTDHTEIALRGALDPWINLALNLPSVIANAFLAVDMSLPQWAVRSRYLARLVECCSFQAVAATAATNNNNNNNDSTLVDVDDNLARLVVQMILERLLRHRSGDEVAVGLRNAFDACRGDAAGEERLSQLVVGCTAPTDNNQLSTREVASLCLVLVRQVLLLSSLPRESCPMEKNGRLPWKSCPWLDRSCLALLQAHGTALQDAFVRATIFSTKAVLQSEEKDRQFCHCVASLLSQCRYHHIPEMDHDNSDSEEEEDSDVRNACAADQVLLRQLNVVSATWSQSLFIQQTDAPLQRHLTYFLLSGMDLLQTIDETSPLTSNVLSGVTERLHSPLVSIRKYGMYVAETLARRLGQDLQFTELDEERKQEQAADVAQQPGPPRNANVPNKVEKRRRIQKIRRMSQVDPDAEYVTDDEEDEEDGNSITEHSHVSSSSGLDDDSVWDDQDEFTPYSLKDDEEDLRETPRPLYLSDCLDLLRTPESDEHALSRHAAALQELGPLVRTHPADLADLGVSLAVQLLRMEDKFSLESFDDMVHTSLCALVVEEPLSVGQALIAEIFEECSLKNRLDALSALNYAAFELCGNKALEESARGRLGKM